ncbi:hypothetical protein [Streptomyces sp. NPDC053069]|uniref:hypothetical protein n=1 Tax=Streptomyces sp. NPDC053069 TaxID=3365695 RepID=UPI0037D2A90A
MTGRWRCSARPQALKAQLYDNLRNLGVEALDVVTTRSPAERHRGLNVSAG